MTTKPLSESLNPWLAELIQAGTAPLSACPDESRETIAAYGVNFEDDKAVLIPGFKCLSQSDLLASLPARWGQQWDIRFHAVAASTNTALVELASHQSIDGTVVTADLQVSGKGRRGRPWISPIGYGVAASVGFEPDMPAHGLMGLSLAVGVTVVRALAALGVQGVSLKWPNDVLCDGAKLAGILVEVARTDPLRVVIGIGVNVGNESLIGPTVDQPTSDLTAYPHITREKLLAGLLARLSDDLNVFEREGFAPFRRDWESLHEYQGASVTLLQGTQKFDGVVRGVGLEGQLELATQSGLREFVAGEVSLRPRNGVRT